MLTSAVCFLTLQFGNSKKYEHAHMDTNSCTRQRIKWNQHPTHALWMCVVAKTTSSLAEKFPKSKNPSQPPSVCKLHDAQSALWPCMHAFINNKKELMTERKVNAKLSKEQWKSFSLLWRISLTLYITVIQRKNLTDNPSSCFCFRYIIHLCANLEEPSQSPS